MSLTIFLSIPIREGLRDVLWSRAVDLKMTVEEYCALVLESKALQFEEQTLKEKEDAK